MIHGMKVAVVLPAYNAEKTLEKTYREIPLGVVDEVLLVDDGSGDGTPEAARALGLDPIVHPENRGYGGNQKTCYAEALKKGADIVVMIHPDYQYSPKLVTAMAAMIASGHYDIVLGSRILGKGALAGGMPLYKYVSNRILTFVQNVLLGCKLSEYHTGLRAFHRKVLTSLPLLENSNNFIFDNQMLVQSVFFDFRIGEISCPTRYAVESSSIQFLPSMRYGLGVLLTSFQFRLARWNLGSFGFLDRRGRTLASESEPLP
jgi:glycosyltransferase involved in cell wall biosynthesis